MRLQVFSRDDFPPLTNEDLRAIQEVVRYAEEHRHSKEDLYAVMAGATGCAGDDPYMACHLHNGLRAAFSYEHQPVGWCRHLSVSNTDYPDKVATPQMVEVIMKEFGFTGTLYDMINVWFEDAYLPTLGDIKAINILQLENPDDGKNP